MRAVIVNEYGVVPSVGEFPDPQAGAGEQVVEMIAAGVHPVVRKIAAGTHYGSAGELPRVPGVDGVARLADGSAAYVGYARPPYGTLSERTVIRQGWAIPLPSGADPVLVAGTLNPAMSAWASLQRGGGAVAGRQVVVLGATGTSGRIAVQLALAAGASVTAVGRNPEALQGLAGMGARPVSIAGSTGDRAAALVQALDPVPDVVLDYLWGPVAEAAIGVLSRSGLEYEPRPTRWVQIGDTAGAALTLPAAALRSTGLTLLGSGSGSIDPVEIAAAIPDMLERIAAGTVGVSVRTAPLADASMAWAEPEVSGQRLVITCC